MMRKYVYLFFLILLCGCATSNKIAKENTGLDSLIDMDGYYIAQRECDTTFFSVFRFYADGRFAIATTKSKPKELIDCFVSPNDSKICQYISWGTYRLEANSIKTETIRKEGIAKCVIYRDYEIQSDKSLINISDYVIAKNTKIGYMKNYPSFRENACSVKSKFYPN